MFEKLRETGAQVKGYFDVQFSTDEEKWLSSAVTDIYINFKYRTITVTITSLLTPLQLSSLLTFMVEDNPTLTYIVNNIKNEPVFQVDFQQCSVDDFTTDNTLEEGNSLVTYSLSLTYQTPKISKLIVEVSQY